jgi:hypothetical protein
MFVENQPMNKLILLENGLLGGFKGFFLSSFRSRF